MSGPIDIAYAALADRIAAGLAASGFLTDGARLEVDPDEPASLDGEAADFESAAILLQLGTAAVRTILGGGPGKVRYVVERQVRLELAIIGDVDRRSPAFSAGMVAMATLGGDDPTLGGSAERVGLLSQEDGDLPPNGRKTFLTYFVRVRSGDPLGLTP